MVDSSQNDDSILPKKVVPHELFVEFIKNNTQHKMYLKLGFKMNLNK